MNNISLRSIKYESIKAIFTSIADSEKISRAEISEKTGLSLVTIGKIADALLDLDIISQVKEVRPQAGRRAGMLSVNENKFALILDFTSYEFRYAVLDLRLSMTEKSQYQYRNELTFEENLGCFLAETKAAIDTKLSLENCFGIGIAVSGPYNSDSDRVISSRVPELCTISLERTVAKHFPDMIIRIDSQVNAAAKSNITHVDNYKEKNIVYWYIGNSYVCGAYLVGGNLILGKDKHACQFGAMRFSDGETLEGKLEKCDDIEAYADTLSSAVGTVIRILSPHLLIIEYDAKFVCSDIIPLIKTNLIEKYGILHENMPDMIRACCKYRNSHRGLTMDLRDLWLDRLVFDEE